MNRVYQTHLRGHQGQAFADQVRGIPLEQILCVSLDISKDFHVVLVHNALGEVVRPTFEIDIFQTGFNQLFQAIEAARVQTRAQVVLVGMEPTGHYFENLARHLQAGGQPVTLINSYAVKENRSQQMLAYEKSDEIDVAAIGDLLRRGEGTPFRPVTGIYLELRQLARARLGEVKIQTMLKNRIIGHLDRIFPGLVLTRQARKERYQPLFASNLWECQTVQHLIRVCPDPRQLAAMSPDDLRAAFHARGYRMGPVYASRIIAYAAKVLLPDPEVVAIRCDLLQLDLEALDQVLARLAQLEARLAKRVAATPYHILTRVRGLSPPLVAELAAAIGLPTQYQYAGQVFRRAGLVSGRNDSGARQRQGKGKRVTKVGDVYLRRALMLVTDRLICHQPVLRAYYLRLKRAKPTGVARVATARRANGILWATVRDQRADTLIFRGGEAM
jgi:transposase